MFELFIALFGGLYYICKYINEKTKSQAYDNSIKSWESRLHNIQLQYVASPELERTTKDLILGGEHFDDICDRFADDFQFVFGENWRNELRIPPRPPVLDPKIYKSDAYSFSMPANHIMWVFHLMLARQGKISTFVPFSGYVVGGHDIKDTNIRFAKCIEEELIKAGVCDIRLALELDMFYPGRQRMPTEVSGGTIKVESLCSFPTYRLW